MGADNRRLLSDAGFALRTDEFAVELWYVMGNSVLDLSFGIPLISSAQKILKTNHHSYFYYAHTHKFEYQWLSDIGVGNAF